MNYGEADTVNQLRVPEMGGIERMSELATTTECTSLGDLLDTSVAKRGQLCYLLLKAKQGSARTMRKILDSRAAAQPSRTRKLQLPVCCCLRQD